MVRRVRTIPRAVVELGATWSWIKEMIAADKKKKQELKDCARKLEELQIVLVKSEKARVEVTDRVYAGTRICVADAYMTVRDSMHYCRFIKSQGEVKTAPL